MKRKGEPGGKGIGPLELLEEATSLLRRTPAEVFALYYLGTLPFMLGLLYFWADMSRNADAGARLAGASLGLAILFVWMKYWQARFCGGLSRLLLNDLAVATARRDTALAQAVFQPWSLVVMPLALLVTLPFGWCFAFFQNITVAGGGPDLRRVYAAARRQAALWPGQNHVLILIFLLLGLVVFADLCIAAFLFPRLLKTMFGVESLFTRSNLFLLNSTFWAAMAALTHICVDPLIKAAYSLRCHYGESLATGADLMAELREAIRLSGTGVVMLILAATLLLAGVHTVIASEAGTGRAASSPAVSGQNLDRTIRQVIAGPEFAWRLPRPAHTKAELPGFLRGAAGFVKDCAADFGRWFKRFLKWLAGIFPASPPARKSSTGWFGLRDFVFPLLYGLLAFSLSVAAIYLWRRARAGRRAAPESALPPPVANPDLNDEKVTADELTEERWSALARDLLARGELRLALRALYLASLACLARENLIAIARYKSNRDYERELSRFSHTLPEVAASFSRNVTLFERAWYGMHRPGQGMVETFLADHERIVSGVRQG